MLIVLLENEKSSGEEHFVLMKMQQKWSSRELLPSGLELQLLSLVLLEIDGILKFKN
jgi:hypothetical protein